MHFGRTEKIQGLDPTLPPDTRRTERFLKLPRQGNTRCLIGSPVWAAKGWLGDLYPAGTKPGDFLKIYSRIFDAVELNSSFYHLPSPARVAQWREETPRGFRFCPKVYRGITEGIGTSQMPALVRQFCEAIAHFDGRLGLSFAQFSDFFGPEQTPALERFLSVWPAGLPLAVELRHPAWFLNHALPDPIVDLFYRRKVATVITDSLGRADALHLSLTQPKVLIRFQGNDGHPLDEARLRAWGERVRKWKAHVLEEIYFFTHQPGEKRIPATARLAVRELTGTEAPEPPPPAGQIEWL